MTLDEQLRAMDPLTPGLVGKLAGYRTGSNQITTIRARGSTIPDERLERLAAELEALAKRARELKQAR